MQQNWLLWAVSVVFLSCFTSQAQETTVPDPWDPFQFLIGKWSGIGSEDPGEAITGTTSFSFDLGKRIILRKNRAEYPPKAGGKINVVHEDLMIIYLEPTDSRFHAVYFDNEGHVINYTITTSSKQRRLLFESSGSNAGARFQLLYEFRDEGALTMEFLIAPSGGKLKTYVKGVLKKEL